MAVSTSTALPIPLATKTFCYPETSVKQEQHKNERKITALQKKNDKHLNN